MALPVEKFTCPALMLTEGIELCPIAVVKFSVAPVLEIGPTLVVIPVKFVVPALPCVALSRSATELQVRR